MAETDELPTAVDPWTWCMRRGDFAAAWEISDAVLQARRGQPCWHWPRHQQYVWDGSSLTGKRVLVRCYHGLGDTVQFVRYAAPLRRIAREVIVWAQPRLLPLLRTVPGIDRLLPLHDGAPDADYEVDVEVMELPHIFRSTQETLPADVPYLRVAQRRWFSPRRLNVGIVWRAGDWDDRRSIPDALLASLRRGSNVRWHVLQAGARAAAWPGFAEQEFVPGDVEQDAAVIRGLDLMITIDSFPAHLAGALAVPTWTLLPAEADWRWMERREDSPWYPTMRLLRQPAPGAWAALLARVRSELDEFAATHRRRDGDLLTRERRR